jgi:predicted metal-dependent hydrolase
MSTNPSALTVAGIDVEVVYKDVKTLHIVVYPPDGAVRVIAPTGTSDSKLHLSLIKRIAWILKERDAIAKTQRQSEREMVAGESHYVLGKRHLLRVAPGPMGSKVALDQRGRLTLTEGPRSTQRSSREALDVFYRETLSQVVTPLAAKWAAILDVQPATISFKRMQTQWGSCDVNGGNVILNLELGKYSTEQIEYIVLHELAHLIEPGHGPKFEALVSKHMPDWPARVGLLNAGVHGPRDWR